MKRIELPEQCLPIFRAVSELRSRYADYPELSFTPDGHMVGHIGVAIACELFDLRPTTESTPSCDALSDDGERIEVKTSGASKPRFAFRQISKGNPKPDRVLMIRIDWAQLEAYLIYNGPYDPIEKLLMKGSWGSNGQQSISLATAKSLSR